MLELNNNFLNIKIKKFGAELCSVISNNNAIEYIWQADETIWARHAPNLFPIVGKLKNDTYSFNNTTYTLPQHGFARDNEFILKSQTDTKLILELTENETTLKNYPFKFSFKVIYALIKNKIEVTYQITNTDTQTIYFSVGAHPAFNCPLIPTENFEDYELQFSGSEKLITNKIKNGLISNNTTELNLTDNKTTISENLFNNDALVFCNNQINELTLISKKTKHGVCLTSKNWPYYGIWSKKKTKKFVCLEPWFGIADFENTNNNLNEKFGIITLQSKKEFNCNYTISFF